MASQNSELLISLPDVPREPQSPSNHSESGQLLLQERFSKRCKSTKIAALRVVGVESASEVFEFDTYPNTTGNPECHYEAFLEGERVKIKITLKGLPYSGSTFDGKPLDHHEGEIDLGINSDNNQGGLAVRLQRALSDHISGVLSYFSALENNSYNHRQIDTRPIAAEHIDPQSFISLRTHVEELLEGMNLDDQ